MFQSSYCGYPEPDTLVALTPVHSVSVSRWVYWRSDPRALTVHPERWRVVDVDDPDALLFVRTVLSVDHVTYGKPFAALAPASGGLDPLTDLPAFSSGSLHGPVETVIDGSFFGEGLDTGDAQHLVPWLNGEDEDESSPWLIDAELAPSCTVDRVNPQEVLADEVVSWAFGPPDAFDDLYGVDSGCGVLDDSDSLLPTDWASDPEVHGDDSRHLLPSSLGGGRGGDG